MSNPDLSGRSILIVEDEPTLQKRLTLQLQKLGADVVPTATLEAARALIPGGNFDFAFLDVNLPDGQGTELLGEKAFSPETGVIVMTAHGGVPDAVNAIHAGALDYLIKPFEPEQLPLVLERAKAVRQSARLEQHRRDLKAGEQYFFGSAMEDVEKQIRKIIEADHRMRGPLPPILIQGETGTGKTAIARLLHKQGSRANRELVEVNCASLPETLAESELFGHERGAFTDARQARMGLFEAANTGTLFLDEVPSLSPAVQSKLLTAIEDHKIRRVGANKSIPVDVRLITATNADLTALAKQGKFREDLYHRLDLYRIVIPPLRSRGEDILRLAEQLVARYCQHQQLPVRKISSAGSKRLMSYPWPGNVRELAHELQRAIVFEEGTELELPRLSAVLEANSHTQSTASWLNPSFRFPEQGFVLDEAIDTMVRLAMEQSNGNVSAAGRLLGVPRDFVRYRLGQKTNKSVPAPG
jgi:DNA-binding NtrC family response regulator